MLVILFIWAYFREWKMSVAAIVALAHDVIITVGIYALSGFEVSPATVTGLLTILGFSLYDTVVVFDKIRENTKNLRASRHDVRQGREPRGQPDPGPLDQHLAGGADPGRARSSTSAPSSSAPSSLKDLALALFVGMAAGAYSSIFIATPLLVHLKSNETEVVLAERRAKARERRNADRYASVPVFKDDMPIVDDPDEPRRAACWSRTDDDFDDYDEDDAGATERRPGGDGPRPHRARPRSVRSARARRPAGSSRPGSRAPSASDVSRP